jgi:alpha-tubulin suppressor-like RCC1 family protein
MAITSGGNLLAWGSNEDGELGDGTTINRAHPTWIMDNVVDICAGDACSLAVKRDGSLWAWGSNEYGQLGDGTTKSQHKPVKIMDDVMLP